MFFRHLCFISGVSDADLLPRIAGYPGPLPIWHRRRALFSNAKMCNIASANSLVACVPSHHDDVAGCRLSKVPTPQVRQASLATRCRWREAFEPELWAIASLVKLFGRFGALAGRIGFVGIARHNNVAVGLGASRYGDCQKQQNCMLHNDTFGLRRKSLPPCHMEAALTLSVIKAPTPILC